MPHLFHPQKIKDSTLRFEMLVHKAAGGSLTTSRGKRCYIVALNMGSGEICDVVIVHKY